ncbi:MAG: hypothetical protein HQK57_16480 [Deltaproteobacteria bacterium]|nr:hypothetical protein [Deltaproteobacteria bacterium]
MTKEMNFELPNDDAVDLIPDPDYTVKLGGDERLKVDFQGVQEGEVRQLVTNLHKDNAFVQSIKEIITPGNNFFRSYREKKQIEEINLQVIKKAGEYTTQLIAIQGEGRLKKIAARVTLALTKDVDLLGFAISNVFTSLNKIKSKTVRTVVSDAVETRSFLEELGDTDSLNRFDKSFTQDLDAYFDFMGNTLNLLTTLPSYNENIKLIAEENGKKIESFFNKLIS